MKNYKIKHKIICIPDMHIPYHDATVWKVLLNTISIFKPDIVVIMGDFLDFFTLSRFEKKMENRFSTIKDIEIANKMLDELHNICSTSEVQKVIYLEGNHENRASRAGMDQHVRLPDDLHVHHKGWEWVPYKSFYKIGKISFSHDIERCGKYAAFQSLMDYGDNLIIGHSHRASVAYGGTVSGKTHVCVSNGWGGDAEAVDYRHRALVKREWQHGFTKVLIDYNGNGWCTFIPIINGKAAINDELIIGV